MAESDFPSINRTPVADALAANAPRWDLLDSIAWVTTDGLRTGDLSRFVDGLCTRLLAHGLPIQRVRVSFLALHPQVFVRGCIWRPGDGAEYYERGHAVVETDDFKGSPIEYLRETLQVFRKRLTELDPDRDHSVLHGLAAEGGTDYVALPIVGTDGRMAGSVIMTTHAPEGFSDDDVAGLETLAQFITPVLEVFQTQHTARTLLNTYVGPRTGERVLNGLIRRGDSETIRAALWFSDLRNFTHFTETLPLTDLLTMLNQYFELVAAAVTANGGEILRFIGDAMLIVFPEGTHGNIGTACNSALEAATDASSSLATLNHRRQRTGLPPIEFGVGLHLGEVVYGNVGAPDRLDFTVMGAAVNRTARLESLTKTVGEPVLLTAEFVAAAGCEARTLGAHPMKGVPEPVEVFAPL